MTQSACKSTPEVSGLRIETLPFERIPHQSRLFLDYLHDPPALRRFYPSAVNFHHQLVSRRDEVLSAHNSNRAELCDALEAMNRRWGAGTETLNNIKLLRESTTVAAVTGQQITLFTGPLYTIYKALAAVKLARCLSERGTPTVPVFWMASEDHDWAEVRAANIIDHNGKLATTEVPKQLHTVGAPVGHVQLDEAIEKAIDELLVALPPTEFTPELTAMLRDAYQPERSYVEAFARLMTALVKHFGLVLLDPLDANLKRLASPLYHEAAQRAPELAEQLATRSHELEQAGYHAQVLTSPDAFPLFLHIDGKRHALSRTASGNYRAKGAAGSAKNHEYTLEQLTAQTLTEPDAFSPNVVLRAAVQDYLLPSIAYFGGAAEIAYFAQTSEVYRVLGRPLTPVLPRPSLTLIERREARVLDRYALTVADLFAGQQSIERRVVEQYLGRETAETFDHANERVNNALDELRAKLTSVDVTLASALDTKRRKINYQIDSLRRRFHQAQIKHDETTARQLESCFTALYPNKNLQERTVNIFSAYARHGRHVINWMYDSIDLNSIDHQLVYL